MTDSRQNRQGDATRLRLLKTAERLFATEGLDAVSLRSVNAAAGLGPSSVHYHFGTKDDLGQALVMRETAVFFDEMRERLNRHPGDLPNAVQAAVAYILEATGGNPLLQTILTRAPVAGDTSLLPLLTTRGEPLMTQAVQMVEDWVSEQWPGLPDGDVRLMAESVARIGFSHIVTPTAATADIARDLALVACRCLRFPDPDSAAGPRP